MFEQSGESSEHYAKVAGLLGSANVALLDFESDILDQLDRPVM